MTTTDHDFVDVTITPDKPTSGVKALAGKLRTAVAGVALTTVALTGTTTPAAAATPQTSPATDPVTVSPSTAGGSTVTTTFHHPFYDITQAAFTEADHLHTGDQLQTTDGDTATITGLRLYHQTTTTYDLTIDGLHTYYVLAGPTPLLVHNCGGGDVRWTTRHETADDVGKKYTPGQSTRDPASQWYREELSNEELLNSINNADEGDGIAVSAEGRILGGHHRWDELRARINDGRIDPQTSIRIDVLNKK
ncbi:MAG TPA: polymorphic toxin-type HINT domain-containing protein [Pseudonocardiaceae bacterium]